MSINIIQRKRLINEAKLLDASPLGYITAYSDENNPLVWYFLLKGTDDYEGGEYIGQIIHSPKYPAEPPDYKMLTPNGRFATDSKICLTNSSYHKDTWNSGWKITNLLVGFNAVFYDDTLHGISHITESKQERQRKARDSIAFNERRYPEIYRKFNRTHFEVGEGRTALNPTSSSNSLV
jgi:ubiquitin-conjugating enzyme E2 J2